ASSPPLPGPAHRGAGDDHRVAAADDFPAEAPSGPLGLVRKSLAFACSMNPPLTLPDLLAPIAHRNDATAALLAPGRPSLSHAALRQPGIGRTDRVAVVLPNGPELGAVSMAIASGAVCAPLNPAFGDAELRFYLGDLEPAALVLAASDQRRARAIASSLGIRCLDVDWKSDAPAGAHALTIAPTSVRVLARDGASMATENGPGPDDVALLLHTSGTTSRPKLVALTHRNLCVSSGNVVRTLELSPSDRSLNVMPLFHIHGFVASLLASLAAGGSVACCAGYHDGAFVPWLDELQPTWYTATPALHQAVLAELARAPDGIAANRLRFARSASAPLPAAVMRALESALGAPVLEA